MLFLVVIIAAIIIIVQGRKIEDLESKIRIMQKKLKEYKVQIELLKSSNQKEDENNVSTTITSESLSTKEDNEELLIEKSVNIQKGNDETDLEKVLNNIEKKSQSELTNNVISSSIKAPTTETVTTKVATKPKMDPIASRNLSILITGSVLIVLAAIAFLTTTWHSIPSFIKTIVLFLVAFVFIGASKISKEKYHLDKASKTFFYIGMAYLPICLLSISVFGLFGEYFSVTGEGKYIYLGISTLILSILYYIISKNSDDTYIFYGSLLSQILSVILFTLMFEERMFLVCINLLLYNLLMMLVTKNKLFENVINILPILISVIAILKIPNALILNDFSWYFIVTCLLLSINLLVLELKNSNLAKSLLFNTFLYLFVYELVFKLNFKLTDVKCQFLIILFSSAIIIIERILFNSMKEGKNLTLSTRIVPIVLLGFCALSYGLKISWYYISMCLFLAINFIELEIKDSDITYASAFNLFLFLFGYSLIFKPSFQLTDSTRQVCVILFTIAVYIIENLLVRNLKENQNLEKSIRIFSLISLGFVYINTIIENNTLAIQSYVIAILVEVLLVLNFFKSKNKVYKYLTYIFSNVLLVDISENLLILPKLDKFVPMITTSAIMFYEMYRVKEKDEFVTLYTVVMQAISLLLITTFGEEFIIVLALVFAFFSIYYNRKMELLQWFDTIPLLCLLYCIMNAGLNKEFEIGIMLLLTIGITYFSVSLGTFNVYTLISILYLFVGTDKINNDYIMELLFIVWGAVHAYLYKDEKIKDVFKVLTSIFVTILYYSIATDAELLKFTLFELLGAVIDGMYILNVCSKYYDDLDALEYIFWGIIYIYALTNYTDSTDGIIFSFLIVALIFYGYYKKSGTTFIAGIAAILVNAFALTREFWFSIPWWIYLLLIGGSLVGFAIRNEASENKKKISVGSILKEIKDKVEK